MVNLLDLSFGELENFLMELGEQPFRAKQIWQWLWQKGVSDFQDMSNIAKSLRLIMAENAVIHKPTLIDTKQSRDGTVKFLLKLSDGEYIESVLLHERDHYTQCLSTQVGCAMACHFCATGDLGYRRNLTQSEILGQILIAREYLAEDNTNRSLRNLVFMGMGEPFLNMENLVKSLRSAIIDPGLNFSSRRITVSTVGLKGKIPAFGELGLGLLAVSLHAPNQELREAIMPKAASAYPLSRLISDLKAYPLKPRERITIEYILFKGLNHSLYHAQELAKLLRGIKAKINIIAYNPCNLPPAIRKDKPIRFVAPTEDEVDKFKDMLWDLGLLATIRRSKGRDIGAACGQLAAIAKTN
jgi:23S rRNA (adenine2503-C2)-methyltransferase